MRLIQSRRFALAALLAFAALPARAALLTVIASTTWSALNPAAGDTILVKNGATLTVNQANAQIAGITLGGGNPNGGQGTLSFAAGSDLTIAGSLTLGSGGNNGNLNMTSGGTLTLSGFVSSSVGTFTRGTGTIVLTGTNTLPTAGAYSTYNNLSVSANTTSLGQNTTVAGGLDVSGGTLNTATRTLTVNGTANIDGSLTLTNTTTITGATDIGGTLNITSATGVKTFTGAVSINGTWNNTVAGNVFLGNNLTNNGTFTSGTGTYTFNGVAAQTLTGTAGTTSFAIFVLNNANGLSLTSHDLTVTTLLTLSAGKITTGANVVYVSNGSAIGAGAGRFIEGNLKKPIPTGANVAESFEVGGNGGANYSPVNLIFASVSAGGDVTVSTTSGSHPQLASSGLDTTTPAKLNRWWSIANTGVAFTTYTAAFTYVATEVDAAANATAFAAMRYDGADWNPISLLGAPTTTSLSISSETEFGAFAIGEVLEYNVNRGTAGRFNAYDPPPVTPTNSIQGLIRTKTAGTAFTLRIVHLNAGGTALQNVNKDSIRVELVDASNTGGTYTNNCSNAWAVIATVNTAFPSNTDQLDVTFAALVTNSYPSVRVKVTRTSGGTDTGCSGDRFAIKPNDLVVSATDTDWQTAGTARTLNNSAASGGVVHAASTAAASTPRPFTLNVTARNASSPTPTTTTNYAGSPTLVGGYPTCALPAGCVTGTLSVGSWSASAGVVSASAHYSEAGTFNLQFEDRTFANVDVVDTPQATRTIPAAAAALIGRFVPDRFTFAVVTAPQFRTFNSAACVSRSFTYVGQPFWFATTPSVTLSAVNAGGGITSNYALNTSASKPAFSRTFADAGAPPGAALSSASADTLPTLTGAGAATYTPAAGTLSYTRNATTPVTPFNASITLSLAATDSTEAATAGNGTISATTLVLNGAGSGITFDSGRELRWGQLRLLDVFGPLTGNSSGNSPVAIQAQYWQSAAAGFVTNTADNCSAFTEQNFVLDSHRGAITAANLPTSTLVSNGKLSMGVGTLVSGIGSINVISPTTAITSPGNVRICLDLDSPSTQTDNTCVAPAPANQAHLQGRWADTGSYDRDPNARAGFGLYGAQPRNFIYFRENY